MLIRQRVPFHSLDDNVVQAKFLSRTKKVEGVKVNKSQSQRAELLMVELRQDQHILSDDQISDKTDIRWYLRRLEVCHIN